jgi:hypothetical protein
MRKFFGSMGTVSRTTIESQALKNNMLGDPSVRVVDVYLPAGHDGEGLPLLVDLVGFTSSGLSDTNWVGFRENLPERLDRLIGEQRMPPVVVAFPDCFTRLGGNQYINSASMGHAMLIRGRLSFGDGTPAPSLPPLWSGAQARRSQPPCAASFLPRGMWRADTPRSYPRPPRNPIERRRWGWITVPRKSGLFPCEP